MKRQHPSMRTFNRRGSMITELLIAATLIVGMLSVFAPMSVRAGRLWKETQHQQLALDELSNQMEWLLAVPEPQRQELLDRLEPSDAVQSTLPEVQLTGRFIDDAVGHRVELSIDWRRVGPAKPLTLVGWMALATGEDSDV